MRSSFWKKKKKNAHVVFNVICRKGEGTVPMEIRMKQVTFQKAHSGDQKLVMMEMMRSFLDTHADNMPREEWPRTFHYYLQGALDLRERQASEGSLRILVECRTLAILERLWQEYCCGHLNAEAEKRLLTNDIKERFHVESVKLETTILKTDYLACRQFLSISSSELTTQGWFFVILLVFRGLKKA